MSAHHVDRPNLRASQHHVSRQDGASADLHVHYVLAEPGTVTHHEEHFRVGLFTDGDYSKAFEAAGVTHRQLIQNLLSGRGLYLASRAPLRP